MSYAGYSVMHVSTPFPLILPSRIRSPHLPAIALAEDGGGTVTPSYLSSKWETDSGVRDAKMPGVRHESSMSRDGERSI